MLTTILCIVVLKGTIASQTLRFDLTQANVEELTQEYPGETMKQAVCTHLDTAIHLLGEE